MPSILKARRVNLDAVLREPDFSEEYEASIFRAEK